MKKIPLLLSSFVLALSAHGSSIVFDTFGPADTYDQSNGYAVTNGGALGLTEIAAEFTALVSGNLATVSLGLTYSSSSTALPLGVYLYGDASGSPDNADQTFLGPATPTDPFGTTNNSVISFSVSGTVPITMGNLYWLVLKPTAANEFDVWNRALPTFVGNTYFSHDDSTWSGRPVFQPAYRLTASSVPDSGSTFLLLFGAIAPLAISRRWLIRAAR